MARVKPSPAFRVSASSSGLKSCGGIRGSLDVDAQQRRGRGRDAAHARRLAQCQGPDPRELLDDLSGQSRHGPVVEGGRYPTPHVAVHLLYLTQLLLDVASVLQFPLDQG